MPWLALSVQASASKHCSLYNKGSFHGMHFCFFFFLWDNVSWHLSLCFIRTNIFLCYLFLPTLKAFAWWSDLMVEHAETFLSLFAVDMDAALEVQPPDTWDSFPLFQLLNDSLRSDCMYCILIISFFSGQLRALIILSASPYRTENWDG